MIQKTIRKKDNLKTFISDVDNSIFNQIARTGISQAKSSTGKKYPYVICFKSGRKGRQFLLHREIAKKIIGRELRKGEIVDHVDGNPLNNSRENLRVCSHSENLFNCQKRANSKSGVKGVSFDKTRNKWRAYLTAYGKSYQKRFDKKSDAINFVHQLRHKIHHSFYNNG